MAPNIVSLISQYLTPELIMRMASGLGLDKLILQKVIGAAVPSILGGVIGQATKPGGIGKLTDVLGKLDPGILASLPGMLGGANQKSMIDSGSGMLSGILGNAAMSALGGALAKYAGVGSGSVGSVIGMLAPVVLGTLGQQQKAQKLDAGGLLNMLTEQKSNVQAAMPAGFAELLGGSGLLDGVPGAAPKPAVATAAPAAASAPPRPAPTPTPMRQPTPPAPVSSDYMGWLKWAIPVVLLAALGWYFFGGSKSVQSVAQAPKAIMVGGVDVAAQVNSAVGTMRTSLGAVKDAASAQTALPKFREAADQLDSVNKLAGQIPGDGKKALAAFVSAALPALLSQMTTVLALPGVSTILKPVLDTLKTRLEAMAKG